MFKLKKNNNKQTHVQVSVRTQTQPPMLNKKQPIFAPTASKAQTHIYTTGQTHIHTHTYENAHSHTLLHTHTHKNTHIHTHRHTHERT